MSNAVESHLSAPVQPVPERTLSARTAFSGRLLKVEVLDVELEPGVRAVREVIRHPGAVAVVAECQDGRWVFVRQFRKAVEQSLLEVVAGGLNPGEAPESCARREMHEETGHEVLALRPLGSVYPTPGYNSEVIHLFHATVSASRATRHQGDHDERISVEYLTRQAFEDLIRQGMVRDAKTLAAWLLYKSEEPAHSGPTPGRTRKVPAKVVPG